MLRTPAGTAVHTGDWKIDPEPGIGLPTDEARLKEIGMEGFAGPIKLTCKDHNGHQPTFVQQFDGSKFVKVSDMIAPLTDKVQPLLDADAKAYAEKNAGWPKRTEVCDVKS